MHESRRCEKVCVCEWVCERECVWCLNRIKTATCTFSSEDMKRERKRESLKGLRCQRGSTGLSLALSLYFFILSKLIDLLSWWGHMCIAAGWRLREQQQQFHRFFLSFFLFSFFAEKSSLGREGNRHEFLEDELIHQRSLFLGRASKNWCFFLLSHDCLLGVEKLEKSCTFPLVVHSKHLQKSSAFRIAV